MRKNKGKSKKESKIKMGNKGKKKNEMVEFQVLENQSDTVEKREAEVLELEKAEKLKKDLLEAGNMLRNEYAINLLLFKLKMINIKLEQKYARAVIRNIDSRVKSSESIIKKLQRKGYEISHAVAAEKLNDIAGIRAVCFFVDDVYEIAELLKQQKDIKLIKEKDYIKEPKKNGYQSLHLIMQVPFFSGETCIYQKIEVQLRTAIMDSWAELDNQLCYKKEFLNTENAEEELKAYSQLVVKMDKQMLRLRKQIKKL